MRHVQIRLVSRHTCGRMRASLVFCKELTGIAICRSARGPSGSRGFCQTPNPGYLSDQRQLNGWDPLVAKHNGGANAHAFESQKLTIAAQFGVPAPLCVGCVVQSKD